MPAHLCGKPTILFWLQETLIVFCVSLEEAANLYFCLKHGFVKSFAFLITCKTIPYSCPFSVRSICRILPWYVCIDQLGMFGMGTANRPTVHTHQIVSIILKLLSLDMLVLLNVSGFKQRHLGWYNFYMETLMKLGQWSNTRFICHGKLIWRD